MNTKAFWATQIAVNLISCSSYWAYRRWKRTRRDNKAKVLKANTSQRIRPTTALCSQQKNDVGTVVDRHAQGLRGTSSPREDKQMPVCIVDLETELCKSSEDSISICACSDKMVEPSEVRECVKWLAESQIDKACSQLFTRSSDSDTSWCEKWRSETLAAINDKTNSYEGTEMDAEDVNAAAVEVFLRFEVDFQIWTGMLRVAQLDGFKLLSFLWLILQIGTFRTSALVERMAGEILFVFLIAFELYMFRVPVAAVLAQSEQSLGLEQATLYYLHGLARGVLGTIMMTAPSIIQNLVTACSNMQKLKQTAEDKPSLWRRTLFAATVLWDWQFPGLKMLYYIWYYPFLDSLMPIASLGAVGAAAVKTVVDSFLNVILVEAPVNLLWFSARPYLKKRLLASATESHKQAEAREAVEATGCYSRSARVFWMISEKWIATSLPCSLIWIPGTACVFFYPLEMQAYIGNLIGILELILMRLVIVLEGENDKKVFERRPNERGEAGAEPVPVDGGGIDSVHKPVVIVLEGDNDKKVLERRPNEGGEEGAEPVLVEGGGMDSVHKPDDGKGKSMMTAWLETDCSLDNVHLDASLGFDLNRGADSFLGSAERPLPSPTSSGSSAMDAVVVLTVAPAPTTMIL